MNQYTAEIDSAATNRSRTTRAVRYVTSYCAFLLNGHDHIFQHHDAAECDAFAHRHRRSHRDEQSALLAKLLRSYFTGIFGLSRNRNAKGHWLTPFRPGLG